MKKIIIFMLVLALATPLFASVQSNALTSLGSDVTKPITTVLGILKAIAIVAMVASIIVTGIKYLTAEGGRKQEILKNGIIAVVVCAVLVLAAFSLPKALGLDDTTVSDSAVVVAQAIEANL